MRSLPPKSELPLMAVSMLTVALCAAAAAGVAHAHDLGSMFSGLQRLFVDWQAALPAALGGGQVAVPAAEAAEAATTAGQLFYTAVITTDAVLFAELIALQVIRVMCCAVLYMYCPEINARSPPSIVSPPLMPLPPSHHTHFPKQHVSSTDAAMIYSLEPVVGALMAYAFLGERWGAWGWAGGALILASSVATQMMGATDGGGGGGGEGGGDERDERKQGAGALQRREEAPGRAR
jgi:hypothetical protein